MKNIFFVPVFIFLLTAFKIDAQEVIFNKTIDSVEIKAFRNEFEQVWILLKNGIKEDTIWQNDYGRIHIQRIEDIQFFKDKFAMIYYGFSIVVVLFLEWDGMTWIMELVPTLFNFLLNTVLALF
jgi:hypothetical protein